MSLGRLAVTLPLPFLDARACVALAQRCESEWGYEAIWLAETNGHDSFSLAAAIALATERVEIGTAIVPVYNRTPVVLAMSAATVAQLANDRFVLGLGTSSHAIIEGWNGLSFDAPLSRVRETVRVVRSALAGERTRFVGRTLRSEGFRLGALPAKPVRIYLAALRERMLELAGAIGEGLVLNMMPARAMPRILDAYRRGGVEAERDASRDEVVARFQVAVTDGSAAANARARDMVRFGFSGYVATPVYNRFFRWIGHEAVAKDVLDAFRRGDRAGTSAAMTDAFVDDIAIIGDVATCRARLAEFVAAGVTTPVLAPLAASAEEAVGMLEALAPARG
ncbi:MAG: LLM class F420-dependent oxidoreductase [Myxococcota bacterium]|nr:LLM class F420-dependent oxidoreductase [Myxococcales bacterium]